MEFLKLIVIKKILKKIIPKKILQIRKDFLKRRENKKFAKMQVNEIFEEIYRKKLWTPENEKENNIFYSGIGSHYEEFTRIYIDKIKEFLLSFSQKPSVVDLGCGDFSIGSKLRKFCDQYIAVDIFKELIETNKQNFRDTNVDFRTLDITKDQLPSGDICFMRQVLQHLSNSHIQKFLKLMSGKYKYLVITEHLPNKVGNFFPNIDKVTGPDIRIDHNSGIILTEPPFNLKVFDKKDICNIYPKKIPGFVGFLNTTILQLYK